MTNAEAIEILRANYPDACYEQLREAVDAAIAALEAQNVDGDTISRRAAIDAILAVTGNSSVRELYEHVQEHGLSEMWSGGVNAAIDIIIALPSAQPEPQWIPCSERLPEGNSPVNITWVNHNPPEYYANIKDVPQTATGVCFRGRWYWYSVDIEDVLAEYGDREYIQRCLKELVHEDIEITAWMPLPEPYVERRQDG